MLLQPSLNSRIKLLCCGICAAAGLMVGGLNYFRTAEQSFDSAVESLASETRLMAASFQSSYDALQRDARIVSEMPPISGLTRSLANGGVDPVDGSTAAQWRERLATIFSSVMRGNPIYTQLRFIGLADGGRELVRVNRVGQGTVNIPTAELQQKGEEAYVRDVVDGRDTFFFTSVTLNREHGEVDDEEVPTIRAVMPVGDDRSDTFGIVVINVDFDALMRQMLESANPGKNAFLLNGAGDYAEYDPQSGLVRVEIRDLGGAEPPEFFTKVRGSANSEDVLIEEESVLYHTGLSVSGSVRDGYVGAGLRLSRDELLAHARSVGTETVVLTFAMTVVSAVIASWLAGRLTAPLVDMTRSIRATDSRSVPRNLPTESTDEVGELAKAFEGLTSSLIRSRQQIDAIYESTSDGIFIADESGRIRECNRACQRLFGYRFSEAAGKDMGLLLPELLGGAPGQLGWDAAAGGEGRLDDVHETEAVRKDGSRFPVDFSINEIVVDESRLFYGTVRDISARKTAERNLRLLKLALDNSDDLVVITTANAESQEIVFVNDAILRLSGHEPSELIGRSLYFLHGNGRDHPQARALREAMRSQEKFSAEMVCRRKDGSDCWVHVKMVPIRDEDGTVVNFAAIERDVTGARLARVELIKSNKIVAAMSRAQASFISGDLQVNVFDGVLESLMRLSASPFGFIDELSRDEHGRPVFTQRAFKHVVRAGDHRDDRPSSELAAEVIDAARSKTLSGVVISCTRSKGVADATSGGRADDDAQKTAAFDAFLGLPLIGKNGDVLGVIGLANSPEGYDDEVAAYLKPLASVCAGLVKAEQDHERFGQSEREIVRYAKALERSNKELDAFAYSASHDLKAPLRVIDNTSRWLEEDLEQVLDEDSKENMALMRGRVNRMEKLLDDLLTYSRIGRQVDAGAGEIVSGEELSRDLFQLISYPEGFEIRFSQEFASLQLPRMPIQQVLLNLIGNAIKHHDKDEGVIEISVDSRDDWHVISVRDDGPGIAPQYHDQVFGMFKTLKPRDQVEGSGMGLAMVRKHVEHLGGEITLESEIGCGCSFRFTWPASNIQDELAA